ncbi:hypothetical protein DUI87_19205 [Hirundo rustica rustica]|uniref:Uncharacterized protein n=1 Tax=Hirundo rustica rustica TaxID=333673 RepID=A0A3M0JZ09_HIRRU|nr:hypothetical protein DUI87_19205 [Hirundo rustica rustica]
MSLMALKMDMLLAKAEPIRNYAVEGSEREAFIGAWRPASVKSRHQVNKMERSNSHQSNDHIKADGMLDQIRIEFN